MITLGAQMLAVAIALLQRDQVHQKAVSRQIWGPEYDYIIVGAGSAGSVLASRLSKNPKNRVLVLEAGGAASILADIPGTAFPENFLQTPDWGYVSTPQKYVSNMYIDNIASMGRGKVVGGSGMINGMVYNRGNERDFDSWANEFEAGSRWSYASLLPYFRKMEVFQNASYYPNDLASHGFKGKIANSIIQNVDPIHPKFHQAWIDAGYEKVDINGKSQVGTGLVQNNIDARTWTRASSAHVYLYPTLDRENLHLVTSAQVTKILISNRTACGVKFKRGGQTFEVKATKEVILSAGTMETPKLLMLSGIGPADHLKEHGISLVADLPVGKNFQDHTNVDLYYVLKNASDLEWSARIETTTQTLYDYYVHNTGVLTVNPASITTFSTSESEDQNWPDITLFMRANPADPFIGTKNPEAWNKWIAKLQSMIGTGKKLDMSLGLYRPRSRGSVKLASKDPFQNPIIDPAFLSDPRDFNALVDGVIHVLHVLDTDYFRSIAEPYLDPIPGCETEICPGKPMKHCRKYIECYVKQMTGTCYHQSSSTPMGNKVGFSVVDPELRVHGIRKLRVIDASVMPKVVNANTNVATMTIADVGADLILQED